ncbi:unnamed protein product [Camellia sinensis]
MNRSQRSQSDFDFEVLSLDFEAPPQPPFAPPPPFAPARYIHDGELVTRGGNLWSISEMFLINMEMVQEFVHFCEAIYEWNPNSLLRLAYYEMMLWIRVNNEDKITELYDYIATNDDGDKPNFKGHQPKLSSAGTGSNYEAMDPELQEAAASAASKLCLMNVPPISKEMGFFKGGAP